jgi:hypothetical protein
MHVNRFGFHGHIDTVEAASAMRPRKLLLQLKSLLDRGSLYKENNPTSAVSMRPILATFGQNTPLTL